MNNQPDNAPTEPISIVWRDVKTSDYYALPEEFALSGGDVTIRNCFSCELASAKKDRLRPYLIDRETAVEYLVEKIEKSTLEIVHRINNLGNTIKLEVTKDRYRKIKSNVNDANWTQILIECLDLTPIQVKNSTQLFEKRLYSLVMSFINAIGENSRVSPQERADALLKAVKVQDVLANHGIDIGDAVEILVSYLNYFYLYRENTVSSPDNEKLLSKIADLKSGNNPQESLEIMIKTIIEKSQQWSQIPSEDSTQESQRISQSVQEFFQEMIEEHPLPSFSFEDLSNG